MCCFSYQNLCYRRNEVISSYMEILSFFLLLYKLITNELLSFRWTSIYQTYFSFSYITIYHLNEFVIFVYHMFMYSTFHFTCTLSRHCILFSLSLSVSLTLSHSLYFSLYISLLLFWPINFKIWHNDFIIEHLLEAFICTHNHVL